MPEMWPTSVSMPVGRDDELAGPARDVGVHVHHVRAVAQRGVRCLHQVDALADGQALAGQRGLGDLERRGGEHAPVGGDDVTGLDGHDVARDELLGRQQRERAVAAHARLDDHHLRQCRHRRRGLALLAEAEHRVEQRQQQDHDPRAGLLDRVDRDQARGEQDDLHRVAVLAQERVQPRLRLRLRERVRPVALEALGGLGAGQARARIDGQLLQRLGGRQHVPGRCLGRGGRRRGDGHREEASAARIRSASCSLLRSVVVRTLAAALPSAPLTRSAMSGP